MLQTRALWKLVVVQSKLYLREPVSVFFTLLFAPMLLILMGFVLGNAPAPEFGGRGALDVNVPGYAAIVIGMVGLIAIPIGITTLRELGALRRFRATPLRPITYMIGDVLVYLVMIALGILLLVLVGRVIYRVPFQGNVLAWAAGALLSAGAFLALGYVLASLVPNGRAATVVGNVLLYLMVFFSGATVPLAIMPESVRRVSDAIPLTHVVTLLRGLWFGEPVGQHLVEVVVLGGMLVVGTLVAALTFRWE
jgi:ABC-2 type transport system permease protein